MQNAEIEKSKSHVLIEIIEYVPKSVSFKTIISKITGNIRVIAIDKGEKLEEKVSAFDTYIQIIEGKADLVTDKSTMLLTGEAIIIPAHTLFSIRAFEKFKMISTVIKSGYEVTTV